MVQSRLQAPVLTAVRVVWMQSAQKGPPDCSGARTVATPAATARPTQTRKKGKSKEKTRRRKKRPHAPTANTVPANPLSASQPANPPSPNPHLNFRDLVLRRLAARSSSIPNRSEVLRLMSLWWRPCSSPRSTRDVFQLNAARSIHIYAASHQLWREIHRRQLRHRVLTVRYGHD
jgi:hypothetical protein